MESPLNRCDLLAIRQALTRQICENDQLEGCEEIGRSLRQTRERVELIIETFPADED